MFKCVQVRFLFLEIIAQLLSDCPSPKRPTVKNFELIKLRKSYLQYPPGRLVRVYFRCSHGEVEPQVGYCGEETIDRPSLCLAMPIPMTFGSHGSAKANIAKFLSNKWHPVQNLLHVSRDREMIQ